MNLNIMLTIYKHFIKMNRPDLAGDIARRLNNSDAKTLHDALVNDPTTKDCIVRPLWYNYDTQQFRW